MLLRRSVRYFGNYSKALEAGGFFHPGTQAICRRNLSPKIQPSFGSLHALDPQRIRVLEFGGKEGIWETLPSDGAAEAEDGHGSDGGAAAVRGGRKGAAVDHAATHFDAGGEAVEDEAACTLLEGVDESGVGGDFL